METRKKDKKAEEYRESMKRSVPKDYSGPDPKCAIKHKQIMATKRPNSELPGNDR